MSAAGKRNKAVTDLLNGSFSSIESVVPIKQSRMKPQLLEKNFQVEFGVLIGITGDIEGKLILSGNLNIFSEIGNTMYGMPLDGEMLVSFSGELGNMVAGGLSTNVDQNGIDINITSPIIMQGNTTLTGFTQGFRVTTSFEQTGEIDVILMLDS